MAATVQTLREHRWPIRWDLLLRYRLIEIVAQWEGRLTTNHLCNSFGIGRQQASKDINLYLKDVAPGNLVYDKSLKGYRPSPSFEPVLTTGTADEYLHVLSRNNDIRQSFEALDLGFANSELLQVPTRKVEPKVLRPLVQAAREGKRVEIGYVSLSSPEVQDRVIAPHTLVCTPLRWHVRAFCEKNQDYRDFVLSRFRQAPEIMGPSLNSFEDDELWNLTVDIVFKPHPELSKAQQAVIAHDYGMKRGQLKFQTRGSLVQYALQAFNVDVKATTSPLAQQVVVANLKDIEKFLF